MRLQPHQRPLAITLRGCRIETCIRLATRLRVYLAAESSLSIDGWRWPQVRAGFGAVGHSHSTSVVNSTDKAGFHASGSVLLKCIPFLFKLCEI
jgi:hypothetical protein